MSKDTIYREDAIKTIGVMYERCDTHDIIDYRDLMLEAVKVLPSADTDISEYSDKLWKNAYERGKADRPQGEWIADKHKSIWDMDVDCYRCSNCGSRAINHSLIMDITGLSYCPNCGARMKGADDDQ